MLQAVGQHQDGDATHRPGDDDRPTGEQLGLDRILGQYTDDRSRKEGDDQRDPNRPALCRAADDALEYREDSAAVQDEHGEDGPRLDHDGEAVRRSLGRLGVANTQ